MPVEQVDWSALVAHIITITGWSWEYTWDEMTIPRVRVLSQYWHGKPKPTKKEQQEVQLAEAIKAFNAK